MNRVKTARKLRKEQTKPESIFWNAVRNRQHMKLKWRRQVPIDKYIADFVCESEKLIVELDGNQHADDDAKIYDEERTQILERYGYRVLRIWNNDVTQNLDHVLRIIEACVGQASPHPAAANAAQISPQGEANKLKPTLADREI